MALVSVREPGTIIEMPYRRGRGKYGPVDFREIGCGKIL